MSWSTALIALVAAFITVGQLSFVIGKEWSSARRIVADPGTDAAVIAEHGCVPAQFAGSPHRSIQILLAIWSFFWLRPTTPKQCFLARRVVGIRDGREIAYEDVHAGDGLRVVLEQCEQPDAFVRSLKRGGGIGLRTLALRDTEESGEQRMAYCVTVRTRGRFVPTVPDGTQPLWLQFDAVSAAPRSTCRTGPTRLAEISEDAVEILLAPSFSYQRAATAASSEPGRIKRRLLRHNANPWAAFAHVASRRAVVGGLTLGGSALLLGWTATWQFFVLGATAGIVVAPLLMPLLFAMSAFSNRTRSRAPSDPFEWLYYRHCVESTEAEWLPTTRIDTSPPTMWLGSSSHCLSIGRKLSHTDAASSIRHQWHRVAPWFRYPRWLCRQAAAYLRVVRGQVRTAVSKPRALRGETRTR